MEHNTFSYNYSASRNKEVENIRRKYMTYEKSKLEKLKKLDLYVQMAGKTESICLGVVGVLVFGLGMCFFLDVFVGMSWLTAILMVLGVIIMIPAYPIYKKIAQRTKKELTPEILRLSEEIIKSAKK